MENSIAKIRKEAKLSQTQLAQMAGLSRPHLSVIENGKSEVSGLLMLRIASALKKPVEAIFFNTTVSCSEQKGGLSRDHDPHQRQNT